LSHCVLAAYPAEPVVQGMDTASFISTNLVFQKNRNRTRARPARNAAGNGNPTARHFLSEKRKHEPKGRFHAEVVVIAINEWCYE